MRQDPEPGNSAKPGTPVDLWLSSGPSVPVTVGNVVGMKGWEANFALGLQGLTVHEEQGDSSFEKGKVFRQDPAAGVSVPKGTEITIHVSSGSGPIGKPSVTGDGPSKQSSNNLIRVPNVVGSCLAIARQEIQKAGFEFALGPSPERSNSVSRQSPGPEGAAPRGSKVTVYAKIDSRCDTLQ